MTKNRSLKSLVGLGSLLLLFPKGTTSLSTTTTTTTMLSKADGARALVDRGVSATVAEQLAIEHPTDLVLAWCRYTEGQRNMGPGALVEGIRSGQQPPQIGVRHRFRADQEYIEQIRAWLRAKLPEVCKTDPRVVDWVSALRGEQEGLISAADTSPHFKAVLAVMKLHHRDGRGSLTVKRHGEEIRAAVRAYTEREIADFEAIAEARTNQAWRTPRAAQEA